MRFLHVLTFLTTMFGCCLFGQTTIALSTKAVLCGKPGEAVLSVNGAGSSETITIQWSNGYNNIYRIYDLSEGDYSVRVVIEKMRDSIKTHLDTTINFNISKPECPVSLPTYFSPNSDAYNDVYIVGNTESYPNFDFQVFNKWGQKVHGQKKTYKPWDGTWNGIPLPDGTYYYVFIFDASNTNDIVKGDLTIIR